MIASGGESPRFQGDSTECIHAQNEQVRGVEVAVV